MPPRDSSVAVVGGGHNSLSAATLLAKAGFSVTLFERSNHVGGAAVSTRPFDGVDVTISPYAYLVSLFPRRLLAELGIHCGLRRRHPASCTPHGEQALVVDDETTTSDSFRALGAVEEYQRWIDWQRHVDRLGSVIAPTLLDPLREASWFRERLGEETWHMIAERPLGASVDEAFGTDLVRGLVLTDGLIGTFARSDEASLRQNRCYLYHVIGNGTGEWCVPVGGMGTLSEAIAGAAVEAGVEVQLETEVTSIEADGRSAELVTATGDRHGAAVVLCGAAPAVLDRLLGSGVPQGGVEGAQVKVNMVLRHLPRLSCSVEPTAAFSGTLHVNERARQLDAAWQQAGEGTFPSPVPCEVYCHSLTDPSVIGSQLRHSGAHVLSLFALQTPGRLFANGLLSHDAVVDACLSSFENVLAEPIDECILRSPTGEPCLEAHTPPRLAEDLALPGGNIFHGDLQWPWAEEDAEVGHWGAETAIANLFVCGSGARRGGAVSGIGGHNAAMAAFEFLGRAPNPG